jgi:Vitamin K-dependent gamma-carboxylase
MALCILSFTKLRLHFIFDFIIWLTVINVHYKLYPTLSAGEYILNQLLFFNCFISDNFIKNEATLSRINVAMHNFAISAVIVQMCFVYFFSSIAKLGDESWINGSAVLMTMQTNHFSIPFITLNAESLTPIFIFLNYASLIYQILFPFVVWIRKVKIPFLVIGILMHLYIAFVMGLVTFSLIMIIGYIYFWPERNMQES